MKDILTEIVKHKRTEIDRIRRRACDEDWQRQARDAPCPADFLAALRGHDRIRVIAEMKRASPSAGLIRKHFDPGQIALSYEAGGAACLSVLTDEKYFQGSLEHLRVVSEAVRLPLLRKDFTLDPIQVYESKLAGAAAVLLIAECLEPNELADLVGIVRSLEMTALVELYAPENLAAVVQSGARLIGINNRNLRTFDIDLRHTLDLLNEIPADRTVVSESGIRNRDDVAMLEDAGVAAILVGEAFMRAADPGKELATWIGTR